MSFRKLYAIVRGVALIFILFLNAKLHIFWPCTNGFILCLSWLFRSYNSHLNPIVQCSRVSSVCFGSGDTFTMTQKTDGNVYGSIIFREWIAIECREWIVIDNLQRHPRWQ
eukprot:187513_1